MLGDADDSRLRAAFGAVLGWVATDLVVYAAGPEPYLAWDLVPASGAAVALGLAAGLVWQRFPRTGLAALAAAGLATLVTNVVPLPIRISLIRFFWAVLLLVLVAAGAAWARSRAGRGAFSLALAGGAMAAFLFALRYEGIIPGAALAAGASALAAAALLVRRPPLRRAVIAAVALGAVVALAATAHGQSRLRRPDVPSPAPPAAPGRPNVVLVILDTVRAHRLAVYGHDRVTTPRLDAFARDQAIVYTDARSVTSWTLPSHASMFTGLFPGTHGADHPRGEGTGVAGHWHRWPSRALRPDVPTLAELLSAAGYRTAAILGNSIYLAHEFGLDRGFQRYDDRLAVRWERKHLALVQMAGWRPEVGQLAYRSARRVTDLALDWLDRRAPDRPFFLVLNYNDAHAPYLPPAPFDLSFGGPRPRDPLAPPAELLPLLYDRCLLWLDGQVGRLLDGLASRQLLDGSSVIVVSDHGEAFGEHDFWFHDSTLYEEVLRIPLYVKPAGGRGPQRVVSRPFRGNEIFDLVLHEAGLPVKAPPVEPGILAEWYRSPEMTAIRRQSGQDVDRDLLAWLDGSLKTIVSSRGEVEAYDLASDPGERRNLADQVRGLERVRARAEEWWRAHPPVSAAPAGEVPADVMDRLKSLGYVR